MPPVKLTVVEGVMETEPPQVFADTLTAVIGIGKLSVTFTPVYGVFFGFCSVMISALVPVPSPESVPGENCFARPISRTFNRAVAAVAFVSC